MPVESFPIEAGHVLMFRRAVGYPDSENGVDLADIEYAPPTFVAAAAHFDPDWKLRPNGRDEWWGSAKGPGTAPTGGGGLHAEQHYEYHRPVRVGDVLSATERDGAAWEKQGRSGTLKFTERITEFRDQNGEPVVTVRGVAVRRESTEAGA
jgi:hypothetical protein